jgi:hypothetical protein
MLGPGFKSRELRVVIDNLGDYPEYHFFLVPGAWLSEEAEKADGPSRPDRAERLVPGATYLPGYPARFLHKWVLVAVPRQGTAPEGPVRWAALAKSAPGVLHSEPVQLAAPRAVILLSPEDSETHHFHLAQSGGQLIFTPGAVERGSNGFGSWVPAILLCLVLSAAVLGMGVWIAWRVRRRYRNRWVSGWKTAGRAQSERRETPPPAHHSQWGGEPVERAGLTGRPRGSPRRRPW